jgi:hypothetical protein
LNAGVNKSRIEQIEAYSIALVQGVRVMDERKHILQPLLNSENVRKALADKFRNTYGAHAYNHLVPLFAQDLVRDLARLYLDDDRRAGSFTNLFRKASERTMHRELREKFSQIPNRFYENQEPIPGMSEKQSMEWHRSLLERDIDNYKKSFDKGWTIASKAIDDLSNDPIAEKIKTFRDKYHAHFEMLPLGEDPGPFNVGQLGLTYNEILDFVDRYMPAIFELVRVLTGSVHDVNRFSEVHKKYGEDMWRILAGL